MTRASRPTDSPAPAAHAPRPTARQRGKLASLLMVLLGLCGLLAVATAVGYYFLFSRGGERPVVLIHSPRHRQKVEVGQAVTIQSSVRDGGELDRVELWVDGQLIEAQSGELARDNQAFQMLARWQPSSPGTHTLVARAFDARGRRSQAAISVEAFQSIDRDDDGEPDDGDACPDQPGSPTASGCPDRDGDGVQDADDACPDTPGLASDGGCPLSSDSDRDGDAILDEEDACPDQPGLYWAEGCPDADDDGVLDSEDACPQEPGSLEQDGCPEPGDRDSDGVLDAADACPDEPGLLEQAGCADHDGDGVRDGDDACPFEHGLSGLAGCPDADGDGVRDAQDLCPDKAGPTGNSGCPLTDAGDRDGDGVHDDVDLAPGELGSSEHGGVPIPGGGPDNDGNGIPDAEELPRSFLDVLEPLWPSGGLWGRLRPADDVRIMVPVEFQALEFQVYNDYDEVHCYAGLAGGDVERYQFEPLGEREWDIVSHFGAENSRHLAVPMGGPLEVQVECGAHDILPVSGGAQATYWTLGSLVRSHSPSDWDGHVITVRSAEGAEGHSFQARYRLCRDSCQEAAFAPPILSLFSVGGQLQLVWLWDGDKESIDGFSLYRNGNRIQPLPKNSSSAVLYSGPACGERWEFQLTAYAGRDARRPDRESPLSNTASWQSAPCSQWGEPAPDERYRYVVEKPWYKTRNWGYYQNPEGHLDMFRDDEESGAYQRYLAEFWGPYGTAKVRSSATGGRYVEFYCDNVKPPDTPNPGVNCYSYRPSPDDIENVMFFSTGNSGWKYGPNIAASTVRTDEDPFGDDEYAREYNVHNDGWVYHIIHNRGNYRRYYDPGNTLLVVAPHPGYPWDIDHKSNARADYIEWFKQRTNNFQNVKRIVLGGYSRGGVLAMALGRELRLALHTGADWYEPAHSDGVKLVILSLDPGGSQHGDHLERQDGNMNIPNDGGSGHYGSGHCHRLDIAFSMGINEDQSSYWIKTYLKNVIGESIYMDCAFHKNSCGSRGSHQREYTFCIDHSPWDGGGDLLGCPGSYNSSTWLRQHISSHDRNNHGDMGTHSRPELVEHYLNFMSWWLFRQREFLR